MRGHVDAETLAEFREDLLPRRTASRVAAHLRECAQCTRLDTQLAGVTTTLARSSTPPMPDALTARITAALAAEAAARSAQSSPQASPGWGTVPPESQRVPAPRRRAGQVRRVGLAERLSLRAAAAAAAVAVVVAGGGYGIVTLLNSGGQPGTASGGSTAQPARTKAVRPGFSQQRPGALPISGAVPNLVHSGTNYQPGSLRSQVSAVLATTAPSATHSGAPGAPSVPPQSFGAFRNLPECVGRVTGGSVPKLVDIARYRGQPAAVIAAGTSATRELVVSVVGTRCSGRTGDVLARTMVSSIP